jgi:hypothetical protein
MDYILWLEFGLFVLMMGLSGFFSSSETSLFSLSDIQRPHPAPAESAAATHHHHLDRQRTGKCNRFSYLSSHYNKDARRRKQMDKPSHYGAAAVALG